MKKRTVLKGVEYFEVKSLLWASIGLFGGHYLNNTKTSIVDPEKRICKKSNIKGFVYGICEEECYPILSKSGAGLQNDNKYYLGYKCCYTHMPLKKALQIYGVEWEEKSLISLSELYSLEEKLMEREREQSKFVCSYVDLDNSLLTFSKR